MATMGTGNEKMKKQSVKINYNEEDDLFFIHKEGKVKGNLTLGNFVIDMTSQGNVIGIEVLDALETLKSFNITKEILKNAKKGKLISKKYQDGTEFIGFELFSKIPEKNQFIEKTCNAVVAVPKSR